MLSISQKISLPLLTLTILGMFYCELTHGMRWKGRRQSNNVIDLRGQSPAMPMINEANSANVNQMDITDIVKDWKKGRQGLIDFTTVAERNQGPFQSCPKLKSIRAHLIELKKNISSEKLNRALEDIETLPSNLQATPQMANSADICSSGFSSIEKQLSMHQLNIDSIRRGYIEEFKPVHATFTKIDAAYEQRTRMSKINEPGSCVEYTNAMSAKMHMFTGPHKALKAKLDGYSKKIQEQRQAIKRQQESSNCKSINVDGG